MSFMFNPHPYNEPTAINTPALSQEAIRSLTVGADAIAQEIAKSVQ